MLSQSDLSQDFWVEAVDMACYLMNRSPSIAIELKIPIEVQFGILIDYSILKIFGCLIYAHINDNKFEKNVQKYIFFDYQSEMKDHKLWCVEPSSQKFIISGDVILDENTIFQSRNESVTINKDHGIVKQVELEVKPSVHPLHDDTSIQPIQDDEHEIVNKRNALQE